MIEIYANAVDMRVLGAPREVQLALYDLLSYFVDGAEHTSTYKEKRWNGRSSFFDMRTHSCPAGFLLLIQQKLDELNMPYVVQRKPAPEPRGLTPEEAQEKTGFPYSESYDYQHKTVASLLRRKQMIAMVATGGGKTNIATLAYYQLGMPTLFVTTRSALAYQMANNLRKTGAKVGFIGDNVWEPNVEGFTVCISQTLSPRLRRFNDKDELHKLQHYIGKDKDNKKHWIRTPAYQKAARDPKKLAEYREDCLHRVEQLKQEHEARKRETQELLAHFEFVILEEAHESSAEGYYSVLRACRNAYWRLALTATPFVRDSEEANMRLMACSGPIGARVTERTLIDRGVLAKPYFKFIESTAKGLKQFAKWQVAYKEGIVNNEHRNRIICEEAKRAADHGLSVLVLVLHKNHGNALVSMLKEHTAIDSEFISGDSSSEERSQALGQLAAGERKVVVSSSILDVGVDVPSLGMVILAGGGKGEVSLRQRIGRGLRAKKKGPNVAFIVDFDDKSNRLIRSHSRQRRAIIEGIDGFKQGVLAKGEDFDYSIFKPSEFRLEVQ